jgi:hypothetical protein
MGSSLLRRAGALQRLRLGSTTFVALTSVNKLCSRLLARRNPQVSETTSFHLSRQRPRSPSDVAQTRSQRLWTPGTWACSSDQQP